MLSVPPSLAFCQPKFKSHDDGSLGGPLDMLVAKQPSLVWGVYPI